MNVRQLVFIALLAAFARPALAQSGPPIPVTTVVESASVRAGTVARIALQVHVPPGLHIQADKVPDEFSVPASLSIDTPAGISVQDVAYPPFKPFRIAGFDQVQSVFEGDVTIGVRLKIDAGVQPGPVELPGRFRLQSCTETQCYAPHSIPVRWSFTVVPAGTAVRTEHAEVFGTIDFGRAYAPAADAAASRPVAAPAESLPADVLTEFSQFTVLNSPGAYMSVDDFLEFIRDAETGKKSAGPFAGRGPLAILALVFLGGLALNLTPCVLPMIPINLAIIGAGSQRSGRSRGLLLGATYGAAMAVVYGLLGVIVILTAGTFGALNASPWFNFGIAALFVVLGLAMFDVLFSIDFSRLSGSIRFDQNSRGTFMLAFGMGAVAALLAGACVAPVVIQVVVFASDLYGKGVQVALALPFVLGLGMALPWPVAGAGFAALPKPGAWMVRIKQVMGVFILAMAGYYAYLGYEILASRSVNPEEVKAGVEEQLKAGWQSSLTEAMRLSRERQAPLLVDFWATWCKNCLVMDKTTLSDPRVKDALKGYVLVKVQSEDLYGSPTKGLLKQIGAVGLPAYAILRPPSR
jgi:cytochrome c biogenesis protein CcdA/DsbC/DsbD-like thiol-disulfide interchange protein